MRRNPGEGSPGFSGGEPVFCMRGRPPGFVCRAADAGRGAEEMFRGAEPSRGSAVRRGRRAGRGHMLPFARVEHGPPVPGQNDTLRAALSTRFHDRADAKRSDVLRMPQGRGCPLKQDFRPASPAPVVKWVGGKRQLLDSILPLLPARMPLYCEPFAGGAALLFALRPERAVVNDLNAELMALYRVIRDDVEALVTDLGRHENSPEYFYALRNLDRNQEAFAALSPVERASRLLYLNRTCYNGLYRVNAAGQFNTPYGRYRNPNIVNAEGLRAVSAYFNAADIRFESRDFAAVLDDLPGASFVYLDPPYDPLSRTSSFTSYSRGGFGREEQIRLKECCDRLTRRGIRFLLSNSATPFILDLYREYAEWTTLVDARRAVNSVAEGRGAVREVLVRNYAADERAVPERQDSARGGRTI